MNEPARANAPVEKPERPRLMRLIKRWFAPANGEAEQVRDIIEELVEERIEEAPEGEAVIDPNERLLLSNILRLRDVTARDIMVPRAHIVAIEASTPLAEALALLTREGHSRLPIYRETLDEVIGLVHIKDLAGAPVQESKRTLSDVARKVLFVSPAARVLDLLLEMRLKRSHMALVVDEYGGIDGLVTIEDVVEQIVGEIEDEHDSDDAPQIKEQPDGTLLVDARVPLDVFEERAGKIFNDEEREATDTLGGLAVSIAGRVPGRGALIRHGSGVEFEVVDSDPRRLRVLRVRNLPPRPATA